MLVTTTSITNQEPEETRIISYQDIERKACKKNIPWLANGATAKVKTLDHECYPILLQSTLGAGKEVATLPAILAQATWLNKLSKFLENAILDSWKRFCQIDYPNRDGSRGSSLKKHTVS